MTRQVTNLPTHFPSHTRLLLLIFSLNLAQHVTIVSNSNSLFYRFVLFFPPHVKTSSLSLSLSLSLTHTHINEERVVKWEDERNSNFTYLCLIGRVEKLRDRKYFCLVEKKKWEDLKYNFYKFIIIS